MDFADIADAVPESDEPALCGCGRGYVGHAIHRPGDDDDRASARPPGSVGGMRTWSVYVRGIGRVGTIRAVTIQDAEREGAAAFSIPRADIVVSVHI